jgi:hypothetical protein
VEPPRVAFGPGGAGLLVHRGRLHRLDHGRWRETPIVGGQAVDVVSARGALWVLCQGTDALRGHALVLRYTAPDQLMLVDSAPVGTAFAPRALGVEREAFPLGGEAPPLVRLQRGSVSVVLREGAPVQRLRSGVDDVTVLEHRGGALSAWRWGEHYAPLRPGTWAVLVGPRGSLTVRDDGAVLRGLPWAPARPLDRVASPWPLAPETPQAAAADAAGRVVLAARDGRVWRVQGRGWAALGALPGAPAALLGVGDGADGVYALLPDGRSFALEGDAWAPRAAAVE